MPRIASSSFRVGKVQVYLRGRIWYLCYHENGQRRRPRVGSDGNAARRLAAQTNAQLEWGDVTVLGFEPLPIPDLRQRWLDHHEHVLRSSINTINRYRTATDPRLSLSPIGGCCMSSFLTNDAPRRTDMDTPQVAWKFELSGAAFGGGNL
jgi:hypothetical protein